MQKYSADYSLGFYAVNLCNSLLQCYILSAYIWEMFENLRISTMSYAGLIQLNEVLKLQKFSICVKTFVEEVIQQSSVAREVHPLTIKGKTTAAMRE